MFLEAERHKLTPFPLTTEQEVEIVQALEDLEVQEDQNAVFMCEVSLPDILGEWYRNGEKIQPTGIVKIRQEGKWSPGLLPHTYPCNSFILILLVWLNTAAPLHYITFI